MHSFTQSYSILILLNFTRWRVETFILTKWRNCPINQNKRLNNVRTKLWFYFCISFLTKLAGSDVRSPFIMAPTIMSLHWRVKKNDSRDHFFLFHIVCFMRRNDLWIIFLYSLECHYGQFVSLILLHILKIFPELWIMSNFCFLFLSKNTFIQSFYFWM